MTADDIVGNFGKYINLYQFEILILIATFGIVWYIISEVYKDKLEEKK